MKKYLAALLLFAAPAFSAVRSEEGVFSSIKVESANGGINPDYAGITLSGTVFAGGNACEANRYDISIKKTLVKGVLTFKAVRKLKSTGLFCTLQIDPNFQGKSFSQTFIIDRDLLEGAVVKNVYELGNTLSLDSLRGEEQAVDESCKDIPKVCLANWDPATCTYKDRSVDGSNACQALARLKSEVCAEEQTFDESLLSCESLATQK